MIDINLAHYQAVEFVHLTGTRFVSIVRYEYEHFWTLKIFGLRTMLDAFRYDDDYLHSRILAVTYRELLEGELAELVNNEVNKHFDTQLELVPF